MHFSVGLLHSSSNVICYHTHAHSEYTMPFTFSPEKYKIIHNNILLLFIFIAIFVSLFSSSSHCSLPPSSLLSPYSIHSRLFIYIFFSVPASQQPSEPIAFRSVSIYLSASKSFLFFLFSRKLGNIQRCVAVWVVWRKGTKRLLFVRIACALVLRFVCLFSRFPFIIILLFAILSRHTYFASHLLLSYFFPLFWFVFISSVSILLVVLTASYFSLPT